MEEKFTLDDLEEVLKAIAALIGKYSKAKQTIQQSLLQRSAKKSSAYSDDCGEIVSRL